MTRTMEEGKGNRRWFGMWGMLLVMFALFAVMPAGAIGDEGVWTAFYVPKIAAGGSHTVALKNDGTVWAWGNNSSGQLGDGTTTDRTTPAPVNGLTDVIAIAGGRVSHCSLED